MSTDKAPILVKLNNYGQNGEKTPISGIEVGERIKGYSDLLSLLPRTDEPAIISSENSDLVPLTHNRLRKFIDEEFDLSKFGLKAKSRIAILLPNGPELAVCILSVVSKWCAAPINPTSTASEIKSELLSTKAEAIILMTGAPINEHAINGCKDLGVGVITIIPSGIFIHIYNHQNLVNDEYCLLN